MKPAARGQNFCTTFKNTLYIYCNTCLHFFNLIGGTYILTVVDNQRRFTHLSTTVRYLRNYRYIMLVTNYTRDLL
jgi:hypothetical protein